MGDLDAAEPSRPAAPGDGPARHRPKLDRRHVTLLVLPIIPMWVATQASGALFPTLSTENPTLLILLSAANRNLIVAAASGQGWLDAGNAVPLVLYGIIGVLRLLAPDPFFYAIGESYGDRAIAWMERRTPTFGEMLRELERLFAKAGWAFALVLPNNYVCLLAGAARMRRSWFWALNITGTIGRVIIMYFVGRALQDWIDRALGFVSDHRVPFLIASCGLVGVTLLREWRAGTSEVQSLMSLEHELEADAEAEAEAERTDTGDEAERILGEELAGALPADLADEIDRHRAGDTGEEAHRRPAAPT
jgi:membrane protein DedA with SNARE-associated domain